MSNLKPTVDIEQVQLFLNSYYNINVQAFQPISGGNINLVYSYKIKDKRYILRLSQDRWGFDIHDLLYKTYGTQGIPMAQVIGIGRFQQLFYCITEEIPGFTVRTLSPEEFNVVLPSFLAAVTKIHTVNIAASEGYGEINLSGNGTYRSWSDYLKNNFSNDRDGFWNNWHQLYETSVLEKHVFDEFYTKMMELCIYCEPHRYLIHGDCHFYNILTEGSKITGIIDWENIKYGDFLYDIASLDLHKPYLKMPKLFKDYYNSNNMKIPDFKERFLCAAYCRGIDCLRFHAKIDDTESYYSIKKYLYEISSADYF